VLPACNTEAVQLHLDEIATKVTAAQRGSPPFSDRLLHFANQRSSVCIQTCHNRRK
jgi:hypothetical protein